MRAQYLDRALKDLKKMDGSRRKRAVKRILELDESNFPSGARHLEQAEHHYRLRSGDDRIVYRIDNSIPVIVTIGNRDDIYRRLRRFV